VDVDRLANTYSGVDYLSTPFSRTMSTSDAVSLCGGAVNPIPVKKV